MEIGRKVLPHTPPLSVNPEEYFFFLTVCTKERESGPLLSVAHELLRSVEFYHREKKWYPRIFLVMPDHVHGLFYFAETMVNTVRDWKRWTHRKLGVHWQDGFFDHRLRSDESDDEKAEYILQNPVRKGLCANAEDWPYVYFAGREGCP